MEHFTLEISFITMLSIYLISVLIQKYARLPLPHSIILLSYGVFHFAPDLLGVNHKENFDEAILFLIPVILMYDALHLKWLDIKRFKWELLYLAVIAVAISIGLGTLLHFTPLLPADISIGALISLLAINMATDAVSVGNIFSQFSGISHKIKVFVEGESLGNDATAMLAFYFIGLPWLINGSFDFSIIPWLLVKIFLLTSIIGFVTGFVGFWLLSLFGDFKHELLVTLATAYISFVVAEVFHLSGILSLIVGIITLSTMIDRHLFEQKKKAKKEGEKAYSIISRTVTTKERQDMIMFTLEMLSTLAVVYVFVSLAHMINFEKLLLYWKEILLIFGATTIIRMTMMGAFTLSKGMDFSDWFILSFAGIKGALSLIMLHAIPRDFKYYAMFESITVGVILLSIFVYGLSLLFFMMAKGRR